MKLARNPGPAARGGFTLIELLVVIAIIAILVALTAAAVMRTLIQGPRTQTRVEIGQLDGAVMAFQSQYGVSYIPSRIFLRKYQQDYYIGGIVAPSNFLSPLDADSVNYLTTVFHSGGQKFSAKWQSNGINWHSNWASMTFANHPFELLEGEQCLVFFLGGIPATGPNGCLGFSSDSANPDSLGGTRNSYYDFKSNRLGLPTGKQYFFAYRDAYGPSSNFYAYFSSYGTENFYNKYAATTNPPASDCATLGVWPYAESFTPTTRYLKPKTFQIISAGEDTLFGPGTNLTLASPYVWNANTATGIVKAGGDDQTNFTGLLLGAPPQ